jgi:hypothetical protein
MKTPYMRTEIEQSEREMIAGLAPYVNVVSKTQRWLGVE